jgi:hypothetical protein
MAIGSIFVATWYIFSRFGMLYQEKSGNHAPKMVFLNFIRQKELIQEI